MRHRRALRFAQVDAARVDRVQVAVRQRILWLFVGHGFASRVMAAAIRGSSDSGALSVRAFR